jgi:hypothetical protein
MILAGGLWVQMGQSGVSGVASYIALGCRVGGPWDPISYLAQCPDGIPIFRARITRMAGIDMIKTYNTLT